MIITIIGLTQHLTFLQRIPLAILCTKAKLCFELNKIDFTQIYRLNMGPVDLYKYNTAIF